MGRVFLVEKAGSNFGLKRIEAGGRLVAMRAI